MKKPIFILLIGLIFTHVLMAQATDLFFSEYIEGSANNKAIEIYNGTGSDIDLSDYIIKKATNGQGWTTNNFTFPENSIIPSYDVWVIANEGASTTILNKADTVLPYNEYNYLMAFNGDDALGLFKTNGKDEILLDIIGTPDQDPGTAWDVAGITEATKDHTLIRKPSVTQGNTDWTASAGTNSDNSEWIIHDIDYFSDLGQHTFNGAPDDTPPTIISVTATSETSVEVVFSEPINEDTANNVLNYQIENLPVNAATLQTDEITVVLQTENQTENAEYTLIVNNIKDLAGNTIAQNTSVNFTGFVSPYTPIADIQNNLSQYQGQQVLIKGIITIAAGALRNDMLTAFIQDNSGRGIEIFDYDVTPQYLTDFARGNEVEIQGTIDDYNQVTEIKNFTYTVLSTGNELPYLKLQISEINDLNLEGTFIRTTGVVTDNYYAGGGTNIVISDTQDPEHTVPIRIWDTTGIITDEFELGYILQVQGVATIYNNNIQLTPGNQLDLTEGNLNPYDFLILDPEHPQAGTDLKLTFNNENHHYDSVTIYWKTNKDLTYYAKQMESSAENTEFYYTFQSPKAGTKYSIYFETLEDTVKTIFPDDAPEKPINIEIPSTKLIAKITIPPKPFNPHIGELFPIEISGENGDKAIVRIFNSEGKLKTTLYNGIILSNSGIVHLNWDGKDKNYNILPIGLYIIHLEVIDRNTGKSKTDKAPIVIGTYLN